jgi:hypothetical protein
LANRPIDAAAVSDDRQHLAGSRDRRAPQSGAAQFLAPGSKSLGLLRISSRDALVQLALALLMVFERRDILITQHRRHPHVRLRYRENATFFRHALRLQLIAQSLECLLKIAMLRGSPSLLRGEESMLDRIARDPRLSFWSAGPVERAALRRLASSRRRVRASGRRRTLE